MNQSQVSQDNNERLVRVEMKLEHQEEKLDAMSDKVDEMHSVFMRAKGAQWLFLSFFVAAGFLVVNFKALLSLLGVKVGP